MVANKVDFVCSHPEVVSSSLLQTESVASPESAVVGIEFGEVHPVLSCLSFPMASSPCLISVSVFGTESWRSKKGKSCSFDVPESNPTERGSVTGADAEHMNTSPNGEAPAFGGTKIPDLFGPS